MRGLLLGLTVLFGSLVVNSGPGGFVSIANSAQKVCVTKGDWKKFRKKYAKFFTVKNGRYIYTTDGKQPRMDYNGKSFNGPGCK